MRATREVIGPAVLDRARDLILKNSPLAAAPGKAGPVNVMADEPVDKAKTLTVLKEFLLLKRDNKQLCGEISVMLDKK